MLDIFAGSNALKTLEIRGLWESFILCLFKAPVGAPKWFSLFGLDKYLFGWIFLNIDKHLIFNWFPPRGHLEPPVLLKPILLLLLAV